MAHKTIKTAIQIKGTPEQVWQALTQFETYPQWNPFIQQAQGKPLSGQQLNITAGSMKFKPTVLVADKPRELRWLGKLFFRGLFDGEHSFVIEDQNDGTVLFRHEEVFNGVLVGLFAKKLDEDTKEGFEAMNRALKALVEQ